MTTTTYLFENNAKSVLASAITDTATSLTLSSGTGALFPNPGVDQLFTLTLTDAATGEIYEIMHCTARTGDVCTVVRAQEGTTALNWSAGDYANNFITAGTAAAFAQNIPAFGTMASQNASAVAITGGSVAADLAGSTTDGTHAPMPDVFSAKGDMLTGGAAGTPTRTAVGADGDVWTADTTAPGGASWQTPSAGGGNPPAYNPQTGTSYVLALTDAPAASSSQGIVSMDNAAANAVTVPPSSSVAWVAQTMIQIIQLGAGQTSIVASAGVTIHNASSLAARAQFSTLLLTYLGSDVWVLSGDFA